MSKTKDQAELEKKRKSYLKKMMQLGEDLTALRDRHRKHEKKLVAKKASYESKLKKIDDRLPGP